MCSDCRHTIAQVHPLIEAIDKNRDAIAALLTQIHQDMGGLLVVKNLPDGTQAPIDFTQNYLGQVMLLQYVSGFMAGECPYQDKFEDSLARFYNTGFAHGDAYRGARQTQLN